MLGSNQLEEQAAFQSCLITDYIHVMNQVIEKYAEKYAEYINHNAWLLFFLLWKSLGFGENISRYESPQDAGG